MPLHQRRLSLALLLIVLLVVPTLLAQTDPLPLPTGESENGRVGSSPTPLTENLAPLTLLSPADGATIVDVYPTFSWTADPNATDYKFILKRGNKTKLKLTFKAVDVCIDGICTANLSTSANIKPLKSDRTYTWSIKASQAGQKLTPSPRQTFMVYGSSVEMNFLPTVTPYGYSLPNSSLIPDEMSRQTLPIVTVNAASVSAINTAITSTLNTNGTCKNQQTVINLTKTSDYFITAPYTTVAPTYGKTGIREIKCAVTIEGNNRKLARSSSATESFRILTVTPGGNLTIRNLTIENGVATERGGGGILAHGSETGILARLSVYNSVIRNNTVIVGTPLQWLGGGIYVYKGALRIEGSSVTGNTNGVTNGDGGGIGVILSSPLIQWNDIRNNNTKDDGNAIYIDGNSSINSNCLVGNHNTTTGIGSISVYAITTGNNWTNNWWGSSAGPFINGTPSSVTRDSAYAVAGGSFTYQPYWSAQPSNCRAAPTHTPTYTNSRTPTPTAPICTGRACVTNTPTPSNTYTPSPTFTPSATSEPGLAEFGIELVGSWSASEQAEILAGVRQTASALSKHGASSTWVEAFRKVLLGKNGSVWRKIEISKVSLDGLYCTTNKNPSDTNYSATIDCDSRIQLNQYILVHELGHVLVGRTVLKGTTNSDYLNKTDSEVITTNEGDFVMGRRGYTLAIGSKDDWQRSDVVTDAGWGSPALWASQAVSTYAFPTPPPTTRTPVPLRIPNIGPCSDVVSRTFPDLNSTGTPFPMQQNPCTFPSWEVSTATERLVEVEEAAADTFLNWVYYENNPYPVGPTPSGFQDYLWRYNRGGGLCYPNGCAGTLADDARIDWMRTTMTHIFQQIAAGAYQ